MHDVIILGRHIGKAEALDLEGVILTCYNFMPNDGLLLWTGDIVFNFASGEAFASGDTDEILWRIDFIAIIAAIPLDPG